MFVITTVVDTIQIPPPLLSINTIDAIHNEIDQTYPNRIIMNVGLVVSRYGSCLHVGHGGCVAGDAGPHFECRFRLIVFRPFVEEVCLGRIRKSTSDGIHVTCGFFQEIFIPAYWMLRPSHYEEQSGLWVWTPDYDEDEGENGDEKVEGASAAAVDNGGGTLADTDCKQEADTEHMVADDNQNNEASEEGAADGADPDDDSRFEMDIGATIRFKVKAINFTQITNTAKGLQATTTTTGTAAAAAASKKTSRLPDESDVARPVRRRSSSVGLDGNQAPPPSMQIIASICEDGLGLTSWWEAPDDDEEGEEEEGYEETPTKMEADSDR